MGLAGRDLEFLELLVVVVLQGILVFEASSLLGTAGYEFLGLVCLAAVLVLGLVVMFWDHLPLVSHAIPLALNASPARGR